MANTSLFQNLPNSWFTCKRVRRSRFGAAVAQATDVTKAIVGCKLLLVGAGTEARSIISDILDSLALANEIPHSKLYHISSR